MEAAKTSLAPSATAFPFRVLYLPSCSPLRLQGQGCVLYISVPSMEPGTYWVLLICLLNEESCEVGLGMGRGGVRRWSLSHSLAYRGQVAGAQCRASDQVKGTLRKVLLVVSS